MTTPQELAALEHLLIFSRYAGQRPLGETGIDDIPLTEQETYRKAKGSPNSEMPEEEANQMYQDWISVQLTDQVVRLSDGRAVGRFEKVEHDDGLRWATISGARYACHNDLDLAGMHSGDVVAFWPARIPVHDRTPLRMVNASGTIEQFDTASLNRLSFVTGDNEVATLRVSRRQFDCVVASLRLLESKMESGEVALNDGDIGSIMTCEGKHPGMRLDEVTDFCNEILNGNRLFTWSE
ncbi:TPA: hypothetical protein ACYLN4_007269 [Burkholderia lata]